MRAEELAPTVVDRLTVAQSREQPGIHLHSSAARQREPPDLLGSADAATQGPVEIGYRAVSGLGGHNVPSSA